jgi:histone H3/H4
MGVRLAPIRAALHDAALHEPASQPATPARPCPADAAGTEGCAARRSRTPVSEDLAEEEASSEARATPQHGRSRANAEAAAKKGAIAAMSDSQEVLVVASKIKSYIKERGDMKTSANVLQALSDRLRRLCDEAIESARSDGRKTVLDRDIP